VHTREVISGEKEERDEAGEEREGKEEHPERDEGRVSVLTHLYFSFSFSLSLLCLQIFCQKEVTITDLSMLSNSKFPTIIL
jgi:hypothetical protein